MESLSYSYEGRGLLLNDDTDFQIDDSRNLLKKWDGEQFSIATRDAVESMEFIEPVLPDMAKRSVLSNQFLEVSDDDPNNLCGNSLLSISTAKSNSINEFGVRFSSSFDKANDEKLTLQTDLNGSQFSLDKLVLSSPEPSRSAKRARIMSLQSQLPTCQVHGCEKDLSSSKEYHRRHKVCDAHSKTAVVIVNGIQQRFCQQCSRFHILAEFDEGKRSCRKRLACHNQRRRKPQIHTHLGSTYFMTDAAKMSMLLSRIVPGGLFDQTSNELMNHSRCLNLEEEPPQRAVTMKLGQSLPTVLDLHGTAREEHPSKICPNTPLSVPELSMGSNLSCALSLLSAQSQNSLAGMSTVHENHCANLSALQNSSKSLDKSASENFCPSFLNSPALPDHRVPVAPQATVSVGSGILGNELSQETNDALNLSSHRPSPEVVNTIDLLELSLHLQRVEQQKYYAQVKLDTASSAVPQLHEEDM